MSEGATPKPRRWVIWLPLGLFLGCLFAFRTLSMNSEFHVMARFGPKLDREQLLLSRFVGIATELFAISATCSFAQYKIDSGEPADEVLSVASYFCRSAKMRIDHHFAGTSRNADRAGYDLTQELLAGKHEGFRKGIV